MKRLREIIAPNPGETRPRRLARILLIILIPLCLLFAAAFLLVWLFVGGSSGQNTTADYSYSTPHPTEVPYVSIKMVECELTYNEKDPPERSLLESVNSLYIEDADNLDFLADLDNLEVIDTGYDVYGDLSAFKDLTNLKYLNLYFCGVRGDVASLSQLTNLEYLNLAHTQAHGSVEALNSLTNLKKADLSYTHIEGSADGLLEFIDPMDLDIRNTNIINNTVQVYFDDYTQSADKFSRAEHIIFYMDSVDENVNILKGLENIKIVEMSYCGISNLDFINYLPNLETLRINHCLSSASLDVLNNQNLTTLVINDTIISGSYSDICVLSSLQVLDILHTELDGDVSSLAQCEGLEVINPYIESDDYVLSITYNSDYTIPKDQLLAAKEIKIDKAENFEFLAKLTELEKLTIGDNITNFDLSYLAALANLTEFKAYNGCISGDIEVFSHMPNLVRVDMPDSSVWGDLAAFANKPYLANINLKGVAGIYGDIASFEKSKNLWYVILSDTAAAGDIAVFADMEDMHYLDLHNSMVYGDMSVTGNFEDPYKIELSNTLIEGTDYMITYDGSSPENTEMLKYADTVYIKNVSDLSFMSSLSNLKTIVAYENVAGDLSQLNDLPALKNIFFSSADITGDLSELQKFTLLESIDLSGTKITGDIAGLLPLENIWNLVLNDTLITGDITSMTGLEKLLYLEVDRTRTTGYYETAFGEIISR